MQRLGPRIKAKQRQILTEGTKAVEMHVTPFKLIRDCFKPSAFFWGSLEKFEIDNAEAAELCLKKVSRESFKCSGRFGATPPKKEEGERLPELEPVSLLKLKCCPMIRDSEMMVSEKNELSSDSEV